jgi:magnesium transporter
VIVDCAVYVEGERQEVDPGTLEDAARRAKGRPERVVWVGLYEPTSDELAGIAKQFDLHPLAVEDALVAHQRPKLEIYADSLFVVLKTVDLSADLRIGELMIFVGDGFIVTVRHGEPNPMHGVRKRLEAERQPVLAAGPDGVLYAIADAVVDTYTDLVGRLEEEVAELEERVFSPVRTNDTEAIYRLKRRVGKVRRAVVPLAEPAIDLATGNLQQIGADVLPFFRDVADHVQLAADHVEAMDGLLSDILQANLAQVAVRQNEDMRRISAWIAIAAVPTMVAGIYGMNFDHMPELRWRYGYLAVIILLVVACTGLYRYFRRSGWL